MDWLLGKSGLSNEAPVYDKISANVDVLENVIPIAISLADLKNVV